MKLDNSKKKLKINTIMSLTFEFLTVVCGFILPKFILESYGSNVNGLVSSITHFLGFISLCELGMGAVVPASLYKPLANKDMKTVSSVVASARKFYRLIAYIMLAYIAALLLFYPYLVNDSFDYFYTASLIVIISISTFAQYYFGITYALLLNSDQKQYVSFIINSVTLVLNTVIAIILIKSGFSIHIVKFVSSLIFVCRPLCLNLYVKRHYQLDLKVKYEGEPIKQKWNGIAQHLASTIQDKADTIVLTVFSSLLNVSIYGVYYMVINGVKGLVYSLTAGMSSYIGHIIAKDDKEQLKFTFEKFEWSMHSITTILFTITALTAVPFVKLYTAKLIDTEMYVVPTFSAILCMALALRCIQMPYNVVVQASGHFKQTQTSAIIEPIINIVVSVVAVYNYGLVGVAIGTFLSMGYRVIYLSQYLRKHIIASTKFSFYKQIFTDLIVAGLTTITMYVINFYVTDFADWIILAVITTVICSIVSLVVNYLLYHERTTGLFRLMAR